MSMTRGSSSASAVDTVPRASQPSPAEQTPASVLRRLRAADVLLPASLALWAFGVSRTHATAVGPYGLLAAVPVIFWAGVGLLLVSAAIELGREQVSKRRMSLHAVALTVMLYGTAPLVYPEGRYSWLYKTVGVVQYINVHGQLNSQIDIYQNWPGFFAIAAWFAKVAGVSTPLAYAKWAQLVFELAALPLLYLIYQALGLSPRQRWLAVLLYAGSNWIGQDYFSPQALGTVLSLGVMAITMRWLYTGRPSRRRGPTVVPCAVVAIVYFVLTFTHELSPYMLIVQLGALAVFGLVRPRWLPVLLLAIALGYLGPHFAFVNSRFGLLNSIGNFFSNAAPPAFNSGTISPAQRFISHSQELLALGMWGTAVLGAWLRRRQGRAARTAFLLAFSPFTLLALLAYGQEGILRVYLFSLPWAAALAALALVPFPAVAAAARRQSPAAPTLEEIYLPAEGEPELTRDDVAAAASLVAAPVGQFGFAAAAGLAAPSVLPYGLAWIDSAPTQPIRVLRPGQADADATVIFRKLRTKTADSDSTVMFRAARPKGADSDTTVMFRAVRPEQADAENTVLLPAARPEPADADTTVIFRAVGPNAAKGAGDGPESADAATTVIFPVIRPKPAGAGGGVPTPEAAAESEADAGVPAPEAAAESEADAAVPGPEAADPDATVIFRGIRPKPADADAGLTGPEPADADATIILPAMIRPEAANAARPAPGEPSAGHAAERRRIIIGLVLAVVVFGGSVAAAALLKGPTHASTRSATLRPAAASAATVRAEAAAWVAKQVAAGDVVACDPQMCSVLKSDGIRAARLLVLGPKAASPGSSAVIVATATIRDQLGARLTQDYAPVVLASFGSGTTQTDIRVVAPAGAAAYLASMRANVQTRIAVGKELLSNNRISLSNAARQEITQGHADGRLLSVFTAMATLHPLTVVDFGVQTPGASASVPLRSADIGVSSGGTAELDVLKRYLQSQQAVYRPASAVIVRRGTGQMVLRIEYAAPSPLAPLGA